MTEEQYKLVNNNLKLVGNIAKKYKLNKEEMNMSNLANGCDTHLVLKVEDIEKYLCPAQMDSLNEICNTIAKGRYEDEKHPVNTYFICNKDEPYAKDVEDVILKGEEEKEFSR